MKLKFYVHIFEKFSHMKSHGNPYSGRRDVACGRTHGRRDDIHDKANTVKPRFTNLIRS